MATNDVVKFYSEYLTQNPALKKEIDDSPDKQAFMNAVLTHGKKAGFNFNESELDQVMKASFMKALGGGQLSEDQLDGVVGGVGMMQTSPTIQVTTIKSATQTIDKSQMP